MNDGLSSPLDLPTAPHLTSRRRLGDLIIAYGKSTKEQVDHAISEQKRLGIPLGEALVSSGAVSREDLEWVLSEQLGLSLVRFSPGEIDRELVRSIPEEYERRHCVLPYVKVGNQLTVVVDNPMQDRLRVDLASITGCEVEIAIANPTDILAALDAAWARTGTTRRLSKSETDAHARAHAAEDHAIGFAEDAPFFEDERERMTRDRTGLELATVLPSAIAKLGADRIVLDLTPMAATVFAQVRGTQRRLARLDRKDAEACLERWKILAGIAPGRPARPEERAFPEDGGPLSGLQLRVVPGLGSEHAAVESREAAADRPDSAAALGMAEETLAGLRGALEKNRGVLLVAGARGAGVSTALQAILGDIAAAPGGNAGVSPARGRRVVTLELEPVRARPPFVQIPVPQAEEHLAEQWLAAVLDLGPQAVGIDGFAADAAVRLGMHAGLYGVVAVAGVPVASVATAQSHLVSPALPVPVVRDLLLGVLHVRRVRLLCPECRKPAAVDPRIAASVAFVGEVAPAEPHGCAACGGTGYRGRRSLFELVRPDVESPPTALQLVTHGPGVAEQALALYRSGDAAADDVLLAL